MLTTSEHTFMNMLNNSRHSHPNCKEPARPHGLAGYAHWQCSLAAAVTTSNHTQANMNEYNCYVVGRVAVGGTASLQQGPWPQLRSQAWPGLSF